MQLKYMTMLIFSNKKNLNQALILFLNRSPITSQWEDIHTITSIYTKQNYPTTHKCISRNTLKRI